MEELYWITRLDGVCIVSGIIGISSSIFAITAFIGYYIARTLSEDGEYDGKGYGDNFIPAYNFWKYVKNKVLIISLITLPLSILCPTTKEAYMIYGVGGTIDYLKNNDAAKKIPDKCIKAVDLLLDNVNDKLEIKNDSIKN